MRPVLVLSLSLDSCSMRNTYSLLLQECLPSNTTISSTLLPQAELAKLAPSIEIFPLCDSQSQETYIKFLGGPVETLLSRFEMIFRAPSPPTHTHTLKYCGHTWRALILAAVLFKEMFPQLLFLNFQNWIFSYSKGE